jgi:N-acetylglucosamine kinase-like BadF-type ATPase
MYGRDAVNHYLDHQPLVSPHLKSAIEEQFRTLDPTEIISAVYRASTPAAILSKLAKALAIDAKNNLPYALESIERNTLDLASIAHRHIERHFSDKSSINLCLAGGVWKAAPNFSDRFSHHLQSMLTGRALNVYRVMRPPLYGAVELARHLEHGN